MKGLRPRTRTLHSREGSPVLACMWVLVGLGLTRACTPAIPESTALKAYRADIIVEGMIRWQGQDILAIVSKTMKGSIGDQEQILVSGFGTELPCFWDNTDLNKGTHYLFYVTEDIKEGTINVTQEGQARTYFVVGNPDVSNGAVKRKIRRTVSQGGPPIFVRQLKDKKVLEGEKVTMKCQAEGNPQPTFTFRKDGEELQSRDIKGIHIKYITSGIRLRLKKADKLLHEGLYECLANNGVDPPVITSLALSICAQTCEHGVLKEKKCVCECEAGWKGLSCNIPIITTPIPTFVPLCDELECGENGVLNREWCVCICNDGYTGEHCTEPEECDITCVHGTIDNDTCSCLCELGYYGNDCSVTAESLCLEGTYCQNGGTCYKCIEDKTCNPVNETTTDNPELTIFCRCSQFFMGDRCEYKQCQDLNCVHGNMDVSTCSCVCNQGYRGERCHVAQANHTTPCGNDWIGYCLNGGTCNHLRKLDKPTCRCPTQYYGDRCELFDPEVTCYEGFCHNGGYCSLEGDQDPCICEANYGGDRCQFLRPGQIITEDGVIIQTHFAHARYLLTITEMEPFTELYLGTKPDSKKLIVTMIAIFVFMMIVIAIVVFIYVKNRSGRERERRERLDQMLKEQMSNDYGGGGTEAADDIQMRTFHNAPHETTSIHMENDTQLHMNPNPLSRPIRTNGKVSPPPCYPVFISLNGNNHVSSKASIHSNNNSSNSANSNQSSPSGDTPPQGRVRDGYEEIFGDDPSETQMSTTATPVHSPGKGDPDTLPSQRSQKSSATSDSNSEESSESDIEGDTIDIPNPQIQAIENHIATSDRESGDYTWDEYNQNMRFSNPYALDMSPVHKPVKPRSRLNGGSTLKEVNILENPILNGASNTEQSTQVSTSPKDNIYNDRLKDVVENSPPSAV